MEQSKIDSIVPGNSNQEVKGIMKKELQDMMWQTLVYLEVAFPHKKGDGTREERLFNTIKPKILRIVNNKIRSFEEVFDSYALLKVQEYKPIIKSDIQIDVMNFKNKWKINEPGGKGNDRDSGERD